MSEITVISTEEAAPLSREEREVLYRQLAREMKLPYLYFSDLAELEDAVLAQEVFGAPQELANLSLRRVFSFPGVLPLVKAPRQELQDMEALRKRFLGGAQKKEEKEEFSLSYQTLEEQGFFHLSDLEEGKLEKFLLAPGEEVEVCGLVILPREPIQNYYIQEVPGNMSLLGRVRSGHWSFDYLHTQLFSLREEFQERNLVRLVPVFQKREGALSVVFRDEEHLKLVSRLVFDLYYYFQLRTGASFLSLFFESLWEGKLIAGSSPLYSRLLDLLGEEELVQSLPEEFPVEKKKPSKKKKKGGELVEVRKGAIREYLERFQPWAGMGFLALVEGTPELDNAAVFDLYASRLMPEWMKLTYLSLSEPVPRGTVSEQLREYEQFLEERLKELEKGARRKAQVQLREKEVWERMYMELMYRWIYIKKFGFEKFRGLNLTPGVDASRAISNVESLLSKRNLPLFSRVEKREKELVLLTYERDEKYFKSMQLLQAPWVALVRKLRHTELQEEKREILRELLKVLPGKKKGAEEDWIRSPEGFPIICPHVLEKTKLELENRTDQEIHSFLMRYTGKTPLYDAYYCKICGEAVTYVDTMTGITMFEGNQPTTIYRDIEGGMREYIWKQVNQIIHGNLEFRNLPTSKFLTHFVNGAVTAIFEFIVLVDKKIRKTKTNTLEEIDDKRKFYTVLYTWALLIKTVLENPLKVKFTFQKEYKKVESEQLFKGVLQKLLSTQNVLLNKLKDVTESSLKENLFTVFTNVNTVLSRTKVEQPKPVDMDLLLKLDPTFEYLREVKFLNWLHAHSPFKGEYVKLLEREWEGISPKEFFSDSRLEFPSPPRAQEEAGEKLFRESYLLFQKYLEERIWSFPVFRVKITRDRVNENIFEIQVLVKEEHQNFKREREKLRELEKKVSLEKARASGMLFFQLPFQAHALYPMTLLSLRGFPEFLLARVYGAEVTKARGEFLEGKSPRKGFHKHSWTLHCYSSLSSFRGEGVNRYKPKEVKVLNQEEEGFVLVDRLCNWCLEALSENTPRTEKPQEALTEELQKSIAREQEVINFFNYFQNRCPSPGKQQLQEGDLFHRFSSHGKEEERCVNCGVSKEELTEKNSGYFEKYRSKLPGTGKRVVEDFSQTEVEAGEIILPVSKELQGWKFQEGVINEVVNKTFEAAGGGWKKTSYFNLWKNLGLAENVEYEQLASGAVNPSLKPNQAEALARVNRLDLYIKELMFHYYQLANFRHSLEHSLEIKTILAADKGGGFSKQQKHPPWTLFTLPWKKEYLDLLQELRYWESLHPNSVNMANFLLEYLVRALLSIQLYLEKLSRGVSQEFLKIYVSRIFQMEQLTSRLKDQRAAAIEATASVPSENEANLQDHTQSRMFDELVTVEDTDKFSLEGVDYEFDADGGDLATQAES